MPVDGRHRWRGGGIGVVECVSIPYVYFDPNPAK